MNRRITADLTGLNLERAIAELRAVLDHLIGVDGHAQLLEPSRWSRTDLLLEHVSESVDGAPACAP